MLYHQRNFATAKREVQELQDLYHSFDGDPKPYFEAINAQVFRVSEFGTNYAQPVVNICHGIDSGIMQFGLCDAASQPDKTWVSWIVDLSARTPAGLMNVNYLETEAASYYETYLNVKGEYERFSGKKREIGAFLGNAVAFEERSDERGRRDERSGGRYQPRERESRSPE